jgi:hypothetical protein
MGVGGALAGRFAGAGRALAGSWMGAEWALLGRLEGVGRRFFGGIAGCHRESPLFFLVFPEMGCEGRLQIVQSMNPSWEPGITGTTSVAYCKPKSKS